MPEQTQPTPRPVSFLAVAGIFVLLSLYGVIALRVYLPDRPPAPQNAEPEHLAKDLAWRATPAARRAALADMRKKQAEQAASYGWVDRKAGIVQLPIERAMELIVDQYGTGAGK